MSDADVRPIRTVERDFAERGVDPDKGIHTASTLSAFGDQLVAEETPLVQLKFSYGINPRLIDTHINNGGSVTAADSLAVIASGAGANSQAAMLSRVPAEYQPGIGISVKFTASFTTPAAGSIQRIGLGNPSDGYFFGYDGTEFQVQNLSHGESHVHRFVITAPATGTDNITITLDGDAQTVAITAGDDEWDIARAIKAVEANFAQLGEGWEVSIAGDRVEFESFTAEARAGAFTYGAGTTGSTATVSEIIAGQLATDTGIAQADWNHDKMDGTGPSGMTLDHTKLNVFKIAFQFLGAGAIEYYVESNTTGKYVLVHRIDYAGNNVLPSVQNPTLPLYALSRNTTNATNLTLKTGSMGAFSQGQVKDSSLISVTGGAQALAAGVEQVVFITKLPLTFNGKANRTVTRIIQLSVTSDGAKAVTFRLYPNPIIGGSPVFSDVAPTVSSVRVSSTAAATATGTPFFEATIAKIDADTFDLTILNLEGVANGALAVTAESSNTSDVSAELIFSETQ